ncbi:MAG: glycosyltransferase family 4 protein [Bryobacteraceae bacterium]
MLKINWFSPLPPVHSGIAYYAAQILPFLARHHQVTAWTDQDQVAPEMERLAPVAHYDPADPPWRALNNADICVYHLGNHGGIHGGIWQVSRQLPGIIVLHDLCLHDFFAMAFLRTLAQPEAYLDALERWYGKDGKEAGDAFRAGGIAAETMAQRFPLTREAVRGALGVVTHSRRALEDLHETPACPVAALDFPYVASDEPRYRGWVATRNATPAPPYRLVVFGYLSRNRRLASVLEALSTMPEREQFRLEICGQLWDEGHIREQIDHLGLGSIVNLYGFLSDAQVEQELSTAHLAINLRYPSMGEASLSQMQFWDYGLPTLVTRTGWYAALPEEATAFVRPEHEIADIQTHLRAFLADPEAFRVMGERGRQSLHRNDPEKYVDALTEFTSEALRFSPQVPGLRLAAGVGADLSDWLHPAAGAYVLEHASREIWTMLGGAKPDKV